MEKISAQVVDISRFIAEIAATAKEQSASLNEVSQAVSEMDKMTQQNAAMSEQATAASQSLARESRQLLDLVSQFRATQRDDGQLRQELAAAAPHVFAKRPAATPTRSLGRASQSPSRPTSDRKTMRGGAAVAISDEDWSEF